MDLSVLALAEVHLDLLFETDAAGLVLRSRDPDVRAPLLSLVRTVQGNRWRLSAALSKTQRVAIESALAAEPVINDLDEMEARPPVLRGVESCWPSPTQRWQKGVGPSSRLAIRCRLHLLLPRYSKTRATSAPCRS